MVPGIGFVDSGYGYGSNTEVTEVTRAGIEVLQNSQKFRVRWHGRTEPTEVPGAGMNVIQNSQKLRVRV